jgi:hypothetical protein
LDVNLNAFGMPKDIKANFPTDPFWKRFENDPEAARAKALKWWNDPEHGQARRDAASARMSAQNTTYWNDADHRQARRDAASARASARNTAYWNDDDHGQERRDAQAGVSRGKLKRKRGEGAGPLVVLPNVIHRVQHYIVPGAKGDRRAVCDGTVLCAVCKTYKTSRWHPGENPDEKICQRCYLRDKVRTCWSHARVPLHRVPPHLSSSRRLTTTTSAPGAAPRTDRPGSSPGAS